MTFQLTMPNKNGSGMPETLQINTSLVIVAPNGYGKTRLADKFIKSNQQDITGISALRVLSSEKHGSSQNPVDLTKPVENFRYLIDHFQHNYAEEVGKLGIATIDSKVYVPSPLFDQVIYIWNQVFPNRFLGINKGVSGGSIGAKIIVGDIPSNSRYPLSELSGGELVALYHILSCVLEFSDKFTSQKHLIVVDEPEIHLHKAVVTKLWDVIEQCWNDRHFVYLTHDLEFAASRRSASKVYIREYTYPDTWHWDTVPSIESLPQDVILRIVGQPKHVLLIEGEYNSYDFAIYSALFSDYQVIPFGGCTDIERALRSVGLNDKPKLAHVELSGIVDRDFHSDERLQDWENKNLFHLKLATIENFFWTPEIIRYTADNQGRNAIEVLENANNWLIQDYIKNNVDKLVAERSQAEIRFKLDGFDVSGISSSIDLQSALTQRVSDINVDNIFNTNRALYENIIKDNDYNKALQYVPLKPVKKIRDFLGFQTMEMYTQFVITHLKSRKIDDATLKKLRSYISIP